MSGDVRGCNSNSLGQCPFCMAALWQQSPDVDEHDLARIGRVIEAWSSLPEHIKLAIEALSLRE